MNAKNGYGAFNDDFEKLGDVEKKTLSKWLKEHYDPATPLKTHLEKLAWLERVYKARKMDDDFWCRFYRLMAYMNREDKPKSLAYVKQAMPLLEKQLETKPRRPRTHRNALPPRRISTRRCAGSRALFPNVPLVALGLVAINCGSLVKPPAATPPSPGQACSNGCHESTKRQPNSTTVAVPRRQPTRRSSTNCEELRRTEPGRKRN